MVKLYKIKFIKDSEKCKEGDIKEATKKNAESYVKNGYAEYVEEPKQKENIKKSIKKKGDKKATKKEKDNAKYNSDLLTIEGGGRKLINSLIEDGFYPLSIGNKNCIGLNILPENYKKWVIMANQEVEEENKIRDVEEKINSWAYTWDSDRIKTLNEVKKYANKEFTFSDLKSAIELKVKDKKEKIKEVEKDDEKNKEEKRLEESKSKGLENEILTLLLLKKKEDASELIVEHIKKNNYIYTTKDDIKPEIWIYKKGIYISQGKSEIEKQVRSLLGKAFTKQLSEEVLHKIKADTQIELDEFFKTNYLDEIPVENGILNIFTRELKPFNPEKIFFNKIPIKYNKESKCPIILKFFKDVLKDESDVPVILEIFGFSLLKEYRFEKAFMFVGLGRNGKSKTIELLKKMLGISNCCSVPLSMIIADSTSVCELFGKMVNLAGDLSNDSLKKTGMFKQTVGRDLIAAKRKYLKDLPFVNYAKHIFACNELPKVYDLTDGFWTKWVLLEFPYKFIPKKEYDELLDKENNKILDPDIIEKITTPEEMSGLLNLALDNLKNLIKNKDFSYSIGTSDIKDFWIRQSDSFAAFCMDKIEEDYNGEISKKKLRKEYNWYCKRHKLKGCSDKAIKAGLEDRYGAIESQKWDGARERYWEGIKLKENNL